MNCREDVINVGKTILGRELTKAEVDELTEAMEDRYLLYQETYVNGEDVDALFDEDFYDGLKENINEMLKSK